MLFSHNFMKKLFKVTDGSKIGSRDKVLKMSIVFNLFLNPLGANPTKWSNRLKRFVGNFPTNCLSVFDHFVKLALKGLIP